MELLPEYIGELPNICGSESEIERSRAQSADHQHYLAESRIDFGSIDSACAVALHMHQPLIPAGGHDLHTAAIISNLQYMMENPGIGDNHNAAAFVQCYRRMADFIPQLLSEGKNPRVMLEYSGTLFHGLRKMGEDHVIDALKRITLDPEMRRSVEWLGAPWGHAVAPSTPVQDFRRHVVAFQHHFAAIFGMEALSRVRGFSPSEMALPNHPDIAYEYVKTLKDAGYRWLLVQEHSVEHPVTGEGVRQPHVPHRLVVVNSEGETTSIVAIVKTQGSDTKLVAQMQPYYEAKGLSQLSLAGRMIPQLVTQIADGENGGVMMNEFPPKYMEVVREASGSRVPLVNVSEYLEHLASIGVTPKDFAPVQPIHQKRIWERIKPGDGPQKLAQAIESLKAEDHRFHVDGGSWTNDISWVKGYENVLGPMEQVSAEFAAAMRKTEPTTDNAAYRNALFHLMTGQTSCYRYWGQGQWTDYGREILRRASEVLRHDF